MVAGEGPISDGVPRTVGEGGLSERAMPPPPRNSTPILEIDKTKRMRKASR